MRSDARRRGIASALLDLAERSGAGRSAPTLELQVHKANSDALRFYERVGFVQASETDGGSVFVMRRKRS